MAWGAVSLAARDFFGFFTGFIGGGVIGAPWEIPECVGKRRKVVSTAEPAGSLQKKHENCNVSQG